MLLETPRRFPLQQGHLPKFDRSRCDMGSSRRTGPEHVAHRISSALSFALRNKKRRRERCFVLPEGRLGREIDTIDLHESHAQGALATPEKPMPTKTFFSMSQESQVIRIPLPMPCTIRKGCVAIICEYKPKKSWLEWVATTQIAL
jgi:hypothetical protein